MGIGARVVAVRPMSTQRVGSPFAAMTLKK